MNHLLRVLFLLLIAIPSWAQDTVLPGPKEEETPLELETVPLSEEDTVITKEYPVEGYYEKAPKKDNSLPENLVVEQEYITIRRTEHIQDAIPRYKDRRNRWGSLIALTYGVFSPVNYQPNFSSGDFASVYGEGFGSLFEFTASGKWNLPFGSFVMGGGVGYTKRTSTDGNATLTLIPIRIEGAFVLDMIFNEPMIAPYVVGGTYVNIYKEVQADVSFNGQTQIAPYFGIGANFQLDWLDSEAGVNTFIEYGLQNTFLYIEGRQFIASGNASDPDFSTSFQLAAGAKLEY